MSDKHGRAFNPEEPPFLVGVLTYLSYFVYICIGHVRDFFTRLKFRLGFGLAKGKSAELSSSLLPPPAGYAPMIRDFDDFYTRRLYLRLASVFSRPILSRAGPWIDVLYRKPTTMVRPRLAPDAPVMRCINLASYNYLGYSEAPPELDAEVEAALKTYGVAMGGASAAEAGLSAPVADLGREIAAFVGKEAAIVVGMGFATNATGIPGLVGEGTLIVSDSLNHSSIVAGVRSASGSRVVVFRHNDVADLERVLRENIAFGQPRTRRPWRKALIVVEGIYSMEGEMCPLRAIVEIKKKYKAYLFVDEAHSIGALGPTGRGVCEELGVDPADVDVLMGTFTKSFASVGGYIAASADVVAAVRAASHGVVHATAMEPACAVQALAALRLLSTGSAEGRRRLAALRRNTKYLRSKLKEAGCRVLGEDSSPVVPLMLYAPSKIDTFSRECLARGVAVQTVGYPATSIIASRVRLCVSAAHTEADLEQAVRVLLEVAEGTLIRYERGFLG